MSATGRGLDQPPRAGAPVAFREQVEPARSLEQPRRGLELGELDELGDGAHLARLERVVALVRDEHGLAVPRLDPQALGVDLVDARVAELGEREHLRTLGRQNQIAALLDVWPELGGDLARFTDLPYGDRDVSCANERAGERTGRLAEPAHVAIFGGGERAGRAALLAQLAEREAAPGFAGLGGRDGESDAVDQEPVAQGPRLVAHGPSGAGIDDDAREAVLGADDQRPARYQAQLRRELRVSRRSGSRRGAPSARRGRVRARR